MRSGPSAAARTATSERCERPHVVVIGGGFSGLWTARGLADAEVDVTVVDRRNHHTFQPLLYQVATAGLHPQDVGHPLRGILRRHGNVRVRLGTVTGVDWDEHSVRLADGGELLFDHLVIAAGAVTSDYGVPGVAEHAFPLKSLDQATRLRDHLVRQFEIVARDITAVDRGALSFVVAGGGPTGVELAGALVELISVLGRDFPEVDASRARVVLVEQLDALLQGFAPRLQTYTASVLRERGVDVRLRTAISEVHADSVAFTDGEAMPTSTVVWAAGVHANPIAEQLGVERTRGGRIVVDDDLRIPGHPEAFAIGDIAAARTRRGELMPQLAPAAIQQGKHTAGQIRRLVAGEPTRPFRYVDKGVMATIGRNAAVAEIGGLDLRGIVAWLAWLGIHLLYLIGFRNRASVLLSWAWSYLTYDRGVRLVFAEPRASDLPATEPAEREAV